MAKDPSPTSTSTSTSETHSPSETELLNNSKREEDGQEGEETVMEDDTRA